MDSQNIPNIHFNNLEGANKAVSNLRKAYITLYNMYVSERLKAFSKHETEDTVVVDEMRLAKSIGLLPDPLPCFSDGVKVCHIYKVDKDLANLIQKKRPQLTLTP